MMKDHDYLNIDDDYNYIGSWIILELENYHMEPQKGGK